MLFSRARPPQIKTNKQINQTYLHMPTSLSIGVPECSPLVRWLLCPFHQSSSHFLSQSLLIQDATDLVVLILLSHILLEHHQIFPALLLAACPFLHTYLLE